jgi:DNA-binding FadR family transcriptional regulator
MKSARRNLSQMVAEDLLERVRSGELRIGDRLPTEVGLMERYGVGRSAVREAVQSLVAMGILDVRPGRGATVIGIGTEQVLDSSTMFALLGRADIMDLYDLRLLIESESSARVAATPSDETLRVLASHLTDFQAAVAGHTSAFEADLAFHRAIVEATGNAVFLRVLDALSDMLSSVRQQTQHVPGALMLAGVQHQAIYDAIAAGDPSGARAATAAHIASGKLAADEAKRRAEGDRSEASA